MRFESPLWFIAGGLVLLVLALRAILKQNGAESSGEAALLFSDLDTLKRQKPTWRLRIFRHRGLIRLLCFTALIIALARPQMGRSETRVVGEGIDIVLLVDVSGSMAAEDFGEGKTRLAHVVEVMNDFVDRRPDDRIGLISFGRYAYTRCPMTTDHGPLIAFMKRMHRDWNAAIESLNKKNSRRRDDTELTPQEDDLGGTAIGEGLVAAVGRLEESKAKSRIVVLLSDGAQTAGDVTPEAAADLAAQFGVKVYSVAAGASGRVPITMIDAFGRRRKRMMQSEADPETLKKISATTKGQFFQADDRKALDGVYKEIDRLERSEIESRDYREWDERFQLFAYIALALLALEALLAATFLRSLP